MNKLIIATVFLFINYLNFTTNSLVRLLPLFIFFLVVIEEVLSKSNNYSFFNRNFKVLHVFFVLVIIGVLTSENERISSGFRVFKIISILLFVIAFFGTLNLKLRYYKIEDLFVKLVYTPFLIYVILNLIAFVFLGNLSTVNHQGVMLSYIGIYQDRVSFTLANGINSYGSVLGILLTLSLVLHRYKSDQKSFFLLGIIVSTVSLLLTDSRGPLLYSFLVLLILKTIALKKKPPNVLWILPVIGFIGPILLLLLLSFLSQTSFGTSLSRSSGDLESGNNRAVIWFFAFNEFLTFKLQHIFGYGEFGHYTSGASKSWSYIFDNYGSSENKNVGLYMHPHNTFLSIALDYGYAGLSIFVFIQYRIVKTVFKIWDKKKTLALLLLGNLLYFNFVGIGETMFGFYYQNVTYLFFMINVFAFLSLSKDRKHFVTLNS